MLVEEVCTPEGVLRVRNLCDKTIGKRKRKRRTHRGNNTTSESYLSAWQKLETVYGKGRLDKFSNGTRGEDVLQVLANDPRVKKLLTPKKTDVFNCIKINVGKVNMAVAREVYSAVFSGLSDRSVDALTFISWYLQV